MVNVVRIVIGAMNVGTGIDTTVVDHVPRTPVRHAVMMRQSMVSAVIVLSAHQDEIAAADVKMRIDVMLLIPYQTTDPNQLRTM